MDSYSFWFTGYTSRSKLLEYSILGSKFTNPSDELLNKTLNLSLKSFHQPRTLKEVIVGGIRRGRD